MTRNLVENDIKYINHNGVHLSNRTKLSLSNLFIFLGKDHEIDAKIMSPNNKMFIIDFKIEDHKYIQVIDSEEDFDKFNNIKEDLPDLEWNRSAPRNKPLTGIEYKNIWKILNGQE